MKPSIYRFAVAPALVAGAWLIVSASMSGAQGVQPTENSNALSGPARLAQAQADAEARAAAEAEAAAEADAEATDEGEAEPMERPVSFTNEQAARGEEEYEQECEECHGSDLRGGLIGGAPLRGLVFDEHFGNGLPASVLYSYMSSTMPPNAPGRLSPSDYADLTAFLLKENGYQPGAPLPADMDALGYLLVEK